MTLTAKYGKQGKRFLLGKENKTLITSLIKDLRNHFKALTGYSLFRKDQITKVRLYYVKACL